MNSKTVIERAFGIIEAEEVMPAEVAVGLTPRQQQTLALLLKYGSIEAILRVTWSPEYRELL